MEEAKKSEIRKLVVERLKESDELLSAAEHDFILAAFDNVLEKPHPNGLFRVSDVTDTLRGAFPQIDKLAKPIVEIAEALGYIGAINEDFGVYVAVDPRGE